jgi:protein involved in sex pheromone biosynthesis
MRKFLMIAAVGCVLALTGCASNGGARTSAEVEKQHRVDSEYVAYVEHVARKRGIDVHWVNPPRERGRRH